MHPASGILLALAAVVPAPPLDADVAGQLRGRLAEPAVRDPAAPQVPARIAGGLLLFSMTGPDNAVAVRPLPDVTGDGVDEIAVGIDESGVDNVFVVDGASSGTATVVWSWMSNGGLSGGSPYGEQCLVVAGDTDGGGDADLLVGTAWGGRTAYALDSLAGAELWRYDTYLPPSPASGWIYSLAQLSDVTGDGVPEAAFGAGSDSDAVTAVDGASAGSAIEIWRWSAPDAVSSVRNLGDVDGDGADDLLVAVGDNGHLVVVLDGDPPTAAGAFLWQAPTGAPSAYAVGLLGDVTGDGVNEALAALWTLDGSAVRCLNGANGAQVWASTAVSDYAMAVEQIGDVGGDGAPDVVVASWENAVQVLDGATGARIWKRSVGSLRGGDVWTARATGDLNGDGFDDVLAGSFDGGVYALSGVNGWPFWRFETGNRVFSVHPVGDLNGDGRPEVVAGTQDTTSKVVVYVLEGDAGIP